jgi:hypothetical protein
MRRILLTPNRLNDESSYFCTVANAEAVDGLVYFTDSHGSANRKMCTEWVSGGCRMCASGKGGDRQEESQDNVLME